MKKLLSVAHMAALLMAFAAPVPAVDEGEDVAHRRGDPSPSQAESHINDYINQDEQLNLGPDDDDVLVLRVDQKNLVNRFVVKTYPLKNAVPREIRNVFREMTGKEGGRAEVIRDKNNGQNYLMVIAPQWQQPYLEAVAKKMDQDWIRHFDDGSQQTYYQAKHRDIADVHRFSEVMLDDGDAILDPRNNSAVITDDPYRAGAWFKMAKQVDIPEHQARFKIKVYEVSVNDDRQIGLDYIAWKNGPGRDLFDFGFAGYRAEENFLNVSSFLTPFDPRTVAAGAGGVSNTYRNSTQWGQYNFLITAAYVDFLASKGKAKTLAQGELQVRSGATGVLERTDQVVAFKATPDPSEFGHVPAAVDGGLALAGRQLRHGAAGREVGIFVEISPVICLETMEVEISVEVSSVSGYTPQGTPILNVSRTQTSARLKDAGTLVLGGLTRKENTDSRAGMPYLRRIPGLGSWLFGGKNDSEREKQIVVVIETQAETGADAVLAGVPEVVTLEQHIEDDGAAERDAPNNAFGFDQWLLDEASGSDL